MRVCRAAAALGLAVAAWAQPVKPTPGAELFDFVWNRINDNHWDPAYLESIGWNAVRDELRPKAAAASEAEARAIVREMIGRLKQSHFALISFDLAEILARDPDAGGAGSVGIEGVIADGAAFVLHVEPGSPAEKAGVKRGWEIVSVRGRQLAPGLARLAKERGSRPAGLMEAAFLRNRLSGHVGQAIPFRFLDASGRPVARSLQAAPERGVFAGVGLMPPAPLWFESRRVAPDAGYVRFNLFLDPARIMPQFADAVRGCLKDCAGMIIDIRGNSGGLGVLAMGFAGWFIDKPDQQLGVMHRRALPLKFVVNPRPEIFERKLAILMDGASVSTAEIFAGGMQDLKRARIFGTRSAGAALPSMVEQLPNGDLLQYAVANYVSASGRTLEGTGVTPDAVVRHTRQSLRQGRDLVLDAALDWIHASPTDSRR
ncbi:MAG: hypothetical protein FJW40_13025 [Acidobacteria bacterium]|nr:hypothetical protein [Acidobacteriota bacterium]